jgi:hypothetical protein
MSNCENGTGREKKVITTVAGDVVRGRPTNEIGVRRPEPPAGSSPTNTHVQGRPSDDAAVAPLTLVLCVSWNEAGGVDALPVQLPARVVLAAATTVA